MKITRWFVLGMAAIGLLGASVFTPTSAGAQAPPNTGHLVRLLAKQFTAWTADTAFFSTTDADTITNFYTQTVKTQPNANVMDVLVSFQYFTDDADFGIQCIVDGVGCMNGATNLGDTLSGFPAGVLVENDVDGDDTFVTSYNFCQTLAKTKKNLHSVVLNLLTTSVDTDLFAIDVEITSANVKDPTLACAPGAVQGATFL